MPVGVALGERSFVKTGVLLMNTGTADEPTVAAVSNYLREFLMDPAIIGAPAFIRKRIVNHICRNRPQRTVANYEAFWTPQGSPFTIGCYEQGKALEELLQQRMDDEIHVAVAMRYGNPSVLDGLHELRVAGCERVVIFPSYPQQVNVCAGTCIKHARDVAGKLAQQYDWHPELIEVPYFYDLESYRKALAAQVASCWSYAPGAHLVVSYHSTLVADIQAGDPYREQGIETAKWLAQDLQVPSEAVTVSYQSRFDSRKWLQPFTEPAVLELAAQGVRDVCVVCPIFTVDNMETVLEVSRDMRAAYLQAAGTDARFTYVPALGHSAGIITALADAVGKALDGGFDAASAASERSADTTIPHMLRQQR